MQYVALNNCFVFQLFQTSFTFLIVEKLSFFLFAYYIMNIEKNLEFLRIKEDSYKTNSLQDFTTVKIFIILKRRKLFFKRFYILQNEQ